MSVGNTFGVRLPLRIGLMEKALVVLWRTVVVVAADALREDLARTDVYSCNIVRMCAMWIYIPVYVGGSV